MGVFEFTKLVLEHLGLYLCILVCSILVYYKILRKICFSIVDPFFLAQISSLFAFTVAIFLFAIGEIEVSYGVQFLLTQIAFWIGIYRYNVNPVKYKLNTFDSYDYRQAIRKREIHFLFCLFLIYICLQLFVYSQYGIPLFMKSRLGMYEDTGGGGIWGRMLTTLNVFVVIGCFFLRKITRKHSSVRIVTNTTLLFVGVTYLLSGSKSSIISLFSLYFCFMLMYEPYKIKRFRKFEIFGIVATVIVALRVITIQNSTESSLMLFINRLISSGDVFYQGYFSNKIDALDVTTYSIFNDVLGTYRIMSWDDLPKPIGMQLYSLVYNIDLPMGANARHNYLGLVCFGMMGSILFSYLIGVLLSYIRHKLHTRFYRKGILSVCFYALLLKAVCTVETDFTMFVASVNSFVLTCIILAAGFVFMILLGYVTYQLANVGKR